jgi:hypothetical protein
VPRLCGGSALGPPVASFTPIKPDLRLPLRALVADSKKKQKNKKIRETEFVFAHLLCGVLLRCLNATIHRAGIQQHEWSMRMLFVREKNKIIFFSLIGSRFYVKITIKPGFFGETL